MYIKIIFFGLLLLNSYIYIIPLQVKKNYTRTIELNNYDDSDCVSALAAF